MDIDMQPSNISTMDIDMQPANISNIYFHILYFEII